MRKNGTTVCLHAVGEECPWELESDLCCLRGEKSCGTCSRHHILCEELVVTLV